MDQLTFIIRYCSEDGKPIERFIKFLENVGHKAEDMQMAILQTLKYLNLDLSDCRGQSYDNANNMSGIYGGLQAKIKSDNHLAKYVPCAAHSINLVVQHSAACCMEVTSFFGLVEEIYVFFSASTYRWQLLVDSLNRSQKSSFLPKRCNVTRWSSRYDSIKALKHGYDEIKNVLLTIGLSCNEKMPVRCQANGLAAKLSTLECAILVVLWHDVLQRADQVSKSLQNPSIGLDTCSGLYFSLQKYYETLRNKFDFYEQEGKLLSEEMDYKEDMRTRKRKLIFGEADTETLLTPQSRMRTQVFFKVIDNLVSEVANRGKAYEDLATTFSFLFSISSLEVSQILDKAKTLADVYSEDLDLSLGNECVQLKFLLQSLVPDTTDFTAIALMQFLHEYKIVATFPNVEIALRIFICLMVSNASGERSFSTLKRVKNYLRNSMVEDTLNNFAILNINNDLLMKLNFNDDINEFAIKKIQKSISQIIFMNF